MRCAIIAGGRDFADWDRMVVTLDDHLHVEDTAKDWIIIIGCSTAEYGLAPKIALDADLRRVMVGADLFAAAYCFSRGLTIEPYPAAWDKYGKPAGPMRNTFMAERAQEFLPYAQLIAFWDGKSRDTEHMIACASGMHIPTHIEYYNI